MKLTGLQYKQIEKHFANKLQKCVICASKKIILDENMAEFTLYKQTKSYVNLELNCLNCNFVYYFNAVALGFFKVNKKENGIIWHEETEQIEEDKQIEEARSSWQSWLIKKSKRFVGL